MTSNSYPPTSTMPPDLSRVVSEMRKGQTVVSEGHELDDCVWPDMSICEDDEINRDQFQPKGPRINDITRMSGFNGTEVDRIFFPRCKEDIQRTLQLAVKNGRKISIRGAKHCMGGQTIAPWGYVLDMKCMRYMHYNKEKETITCGPGCLWADLIDYLNQFGKSPRTMQSYSTFSVGGSMSVNAHGITTDHPVSESIISFKLLRWDGSEVECSRAADPGSEKRELYGLVLGGYGLFGVVYEIDMYTNDNVLLEADCLMCSTNRCGGSLSEFERVFEEIYERTPRQLPPKPHEDVEIKLARLNIIDCESVNVFVFRRAAPVKTVSCLANEPRQMSYQSQLMYKWALPALKEVRYAIEASTGKALDWSNEDGLSRNQMMFESALPLAKLYSPLFSVDASFVLQEYFVPKSKFYDWIAQAKPIYKSLHEKEDHIILLNTTIRFVENDKEILLRYAREDEGVFAFVLYYRLPRTEVCDKQLGTYHRQFVQITLQCGGTFYLPYRHHYTLDEMKTSYPNLKDFVAAKQKHDPKGLFTSLWFEAYLLKLCSSEYQQSFESISKVPAPWSDESLIVASPNIDFKPSERPLLLRREDSYRKLVNSPRLRREFRDKFLTLIFSIEDNERLFGLMNKVCWDSQNKTDLDIYCALQKEIAQISGGVSAEVKKTAKKLIQLRHQKHELTREIGSIVTRLGRMGELHDYVSVGDNGKLILRLRQALAMRGKSWVVHDKLNDDMAAILERGCADEVGEFVEYDYVAHIPWRKIPDASADLVTMNQGLHHLPPENIMNFLSEVRRVLRQGGLFIVREHDLNLENDEHGCPQGMRGAPIEVLDLAHSVFNAVMGVTPEEEKSEIRAFRPIAEWREIITAAGFCDSCLFEMEPGDPTWDEMMCFYLPPLRPTPIDRTNLGEQVGDVTLAPALQAILAQIPQQTAKAIGELLKAVADGLPGLVRKLENMATKVLDSGKAEVVKGLLSKNVDFIVRTLQRFVSLFEGMTVHTGLGEIIPPEVFLIIPGLFKRVEAGTANTEEQMLVGYLKDIQAMFSSSTEPVIDNLPRTATTSASLSEDAFIARETVLVELNALRDVMPDMFTQECLQNSGFTVTQQGAMMSAFGGKDEDDAAENLAWYCDLQTWHNMQGPLKEIKRRQDLPTKDRLLYNKQHPWHKLFMAFLSAPRVRFTGQAQMAMRLVGLGDIVGLWQEAKTSRNSKKGTQASEDKRINVSKMDQKLKLSKAWESYQKQVLGSEKNVELTENQLHDLQDVGEIVKAEYGYTSFTSKPTDITAQMKKHLRECSIQKLGHLCLNGNILGEMRDNIIDTDLGRALDGTRQGFVKAVTVGMAGTNLLSLKYRALPSPDPVALLPAADRLCKVLREAGVTHDRHSQDGEYTWYKLNEWMQVEILTIFAEFLDHDAWFRFPFMEFLKVYFSTLMQESEIVKEKYGAQKAYTSMAFITDAIPGVVMTSLFLQLKMFALPILAALPDAYDTTDVEETGEELVVHVRGKYVDWAMVDNRLKVISISALDDLYLILAPSFKGLTEALMAMAKRVPFARILQISNQSEVQVKAEVFAGTEQDRMVKRLGTLEGVKVKLSFQLPTDGTKSAPGKLVGLEVQVPFLLTVIQEIHKLRAYMRIHQIYDFYC